MQRVQLWSCGGGWQSTAIAALIVQGRLPRPDAAVMVDTERERITTWSYMHAVTLPAMREAGVPFTVVKRSEWCRLDLWGGSDADTLLIPAYTDQSGNPAKLPEYCSGEWKRDVVSRWAANQEDWKDRGVDNWIGISLDEKHRRRGPRRKWIQPAYPLLDVVPLTRAGCWSVVQEMGWPEPPRSSCWMCPNHSNAEWREIRDNCADDWQKAVELEREIRQRDQHAWLHRHCVPLDTVDLGTPEPPGLFGGCQSGFCV